MFTVFFLLQVQVSSSPHPPSEARVSEASLHRRLFSLHNEHSIVFAAATTQCTVCSIQEEVLNVGDNKAESGVLMLAGTR